MDTTVDNVVNQLLQSLISKIDKQNLDPRFVEKFLNSIVKKLPISQTIPQTTPAKESSPQTASEQLAKTYKSLFRNSGFVEDAKRFLSKVLNKDTFNFLKDLNKNDTDSVSVKDIITKGFEKLDSLKIEGIEKLKDISIKGLDKLKDLKIKGLDKLKDIKILGLEKLKDLKIKGLDKLKDLKIKGLDKLKDLKIKGLDKLKDLKIKGLDKLKDLKIKGLDKLKDLKIKGLDAFKNIKSFNLKEISENIKKIFNTLVNLSSLKDKQPSQKYETSEGRAKIIKDTKKPQEVFVVGIAPGVTRFLNEGLGGTLKKLVSGLLKDLKDIFKKPAGGLGLLGGGLALLLGGLTALVAGLMTDGPFKGLLKILSKIGLTGAIKALELGAKIFVGQFKLAVELLKDTLKGFAKNLGRLFGKNIYRTLLQIGDNITKGITTIFTGLKDSVFNVFARIKNVFKNIFNTIKTPFVNFGKLILEQTAEIFGKVAGKGAVGLALKGVGDIFKTLGAKLFKLISPVLKRVPGIGTIISWGFAYTRFKSGDTIGGIIDILSGIASLFPGIGTAIGIGLDVLNAFLDYKAGGASPEASIKKGNIMKDWLKVAWNYWKDKIVGVFDWFINIGGLIKAGKWGDALNEIAGWIPGLDWLLGLFGTDVKTMVKGGNLIGTYYKDMITNLFEWIKTNVVDKITGFVKSVINWGKEQFNWVRSYLPPWLGGLSEEEIKSKKATVTVNGKSMSLDEFEQQQATKTKPEVVLADGGIVTKPTSALVGEAGPEAVIPLEKYFNKSDFTLNNNALASIASNTKDTNASLKTLSEVMMRMVMLIDKKLSTQSTSPAVIGLGSQQKEPISASALANSNFDPIRAIRAQFA